jgi:hypothetical protein
MSDLVRECRRYAKNWADKPSSAALWTKVANEIERLRHHIEEHQSRDALQQMEIERLTRALRTIAGTCTASDWGDVDNDKYLKDIARDALAEGKEDE